MPPLMRPLLLHSGKERSMYGSASVCTLRLALPRASILVVWSPLALHAGGA